LAIGFIPNAHLESGATTFMVQVIGTVSIVAWAFLTMLALFSTLKVLGILRVSESEELQGLDMSEHGMSAYPSELPGTIGATQITIAPPATQSTQTTTKLAGAK
jgi:Amt family ammonium transporter